jgi:hypothetical protein
LECEKLKIIISKNLSKRMRKVAGFWDTIKNVGQGVADTYDKARMGWEIGQQYQPKPRWQQRMDATMNNEPIYVNVPDPENPGKMKKVLKYQVEDPNNPGKAKLDEYGNEMAPQKNPYYVPGFKEKWNNQAYTSLVSLRRTLQQRGRRLTPKGEKTIASDQSASKRIQQALEAEEQGNLSIMKQLEQEGIVTSVQYSPQNNQAPQQGQPAQNAPQGAQEQPQGQPVAAQSLPAGQTGLPANQQMATPTGTITGVY